jgi:hypothetical protein
MTVSGESLRYNRGMSAPKTVTSPKAEAWPVVPPLTAWEATRDTVHMWSQIVGKTRLATSPPVNHWWHVTFYVSARGLQTTPMPFGGLAFDVEFDFVDHVLRITTSDGRARTLPLIARPVAEFYQDYLRTLDALGIDMRGRIWPSPVEVAEAIRFDEDRVHAAYDADAMHHFWLALVRVDRVLKAFRGRFLGKASPSTSSGAASTSRSRASRAVPRHATLAVSRTSATG